MSAAERGDGGSLSKAVDPWRDIVGVVNPEVYKADPEGARGFTPASALVERFDIEPFPDFSAK